MALCRPRIRHALNSHSKFNPPTQLPEMGALIGLVIQLTLLAVGLMVTLAVWAARVTMMLLAALIAAVSDES